MNVNKINISKYDLNGNHRRLKFWFPFTPLSGWNRHEHSFNQGYIV